MAQLLRPEILRTRTSSPPITQVSQLCGTVTMAAPNARTTYCLHTKTVMERLQLGITRNKAGNGQPYLRVLLPGQISSLPCAGRLQPLGTYNYSTKPKMEIWSPKASTASVVPHHIPGYQGRRRQSPCWPQYRRSPPSPGELLTAVPPCTTTSSAPIPAVWRSTGGMASSTCSRFLNCPKAWTQ